MQVSTGGECDLWLECLSSGPSFHYVPLSPSGSSGCALTVLCTCFWTGTGIVLLEFLLSLSRLWYPPGQTLYWTRLFILRPCNSSCHILGLRKCLWRKGEREEWTNEKTHFWEIIMSNFIALKLSDRDFPGGAVVENLPANAGDTGSSPGLGRSHMPQSNWAREPQLLSLRVWSLCSATREATIVRGPRTTMKSGPHLPQLEKALAQKRRPNTAMNK